MSLKRQELCEVVHLVYDFVEPANFMDEQDVHVIYWILTLKPHANFKTSNAVYVRR